MRAELHPRARLNRTGPVAELLAAEKVRSEAPLLRWIDDAGELSSWTVGEFARAARACAAELEEMGLVRGQRVAIVSGNSPWRLAWQYGIWWLGAVEISINSELRGEMLRHCLEDSDPVLVVLEPEFEAQLADFAGGVPRRRQEPVHRAIDKDTQERLDAGYAEIKPSDLCTVLYTSGTTGPSKGVMLSQGYFANLGSIWSAVFDLRIDDVGYFTLPFFHVDFHILLVAAIESGSALAFNRRFSLSRFWAEAARFDASWVFVIAALLSAIETREIPERSVCGHRIERCIGAPIPATSRRRFAEAGIRIQTFYGQTECDGPTFETPDRGREGSAGFACAGIDVEIHDAAGVKLPDGEIGEIVLRPQSANLLALGYWRNPEATVATRTDLWHRTGDLGRIDPDGFLFYEGRLTDSLRRRGENISAHELETVVRRAPGILEASAIAVRDELGGEDEIKIVARSTPTFDAREFFVFCAAELPRFAVPRYLELVPEGVFVYSVGTGVVQKHRLSRAIEGESIYDRVNVLGGTR